MDFDNLTDRTGNPNHVNRNQRNVWRAGRRVRRVTTFLASAGIALAVGSPGAFASTVSVTSMARLRFAGSNVQCLVLSGSDKSGVPVAVDCFYDDASNGNMGAYHAELDVFGQASVSRTTLTGIEIPGGMADEIWRDPDRKGLGVSFNTTRASTLSLQLGDSMQIGATPIVCRYGLSNTVRTVACTLAARGRSKGSADQIARAPDAGTNVIAVTDRTASVYQVRSDGSADVVFRRTHFS